MACLPESVEVLRTVQHEKNNSGETPILCG
jgi:hypothetical protein